MGLHWLEWRPCLWVGRVITMGHWVAFSNSSADGTAITTLKLRPGGCVTTPELRGRGLWITAGGTETGAGRARWGPVGGDLFSTHPRNVLGATRDLQSQEAALSQPVI